METNKRTNKDRGMKPKDVKPTVPAAPAPAPVPPLFRKIDWLTFGLAFGVVWAVYLWTLAPELTLEDSGELCTGSFYAGIPHPPGYPFWAIYSWFWTFILPFGNVAWRVEVGESFAAALGCGMVGIMVSRGSSMLIEGIEEIKNISRGWESSICIVSGFVAGTLLGMDGFMWKESVAINRISLFGVPWLIAVMLFLMRWSYAPQQRRYLYLAMLFYGICATIHQTLLLSAIGVEIIIALAHPRIGRDLFLGNSLIYLVCLMLKSSIPALANMTDVEMVLFHVIGMGSVLSGAWLSINTQGVGTEWKTLLWMGVLWVVGVSFYFYEAISGMTVPPMQWGYPRTVEGFFHALSRGQYETVHGLNVFSDPSRFLFQLWYIVEGLSESFSWVYIFVGLLPFLFLVKMHKRERNWIIGVTAVYFCVSVLLGILLNVSPDRQSSDLNKVFYTASHGLFALMIGYGLTLLAAYVATHYKVCRRWALLGGAVAVMLAVYCLLDATGKLFYGPAGSISLSQLPHHIAMAFDKDQFGNPVFANLIMLASSVLFIVALLLYRSRGPVMILLGIFLMMPVCSGLTHWYKSEQRNHWFGYWFGHDMFTPPYLDTNGKLSYDNVRRAALLKDPKNAKLIYPEMARDTVLFGGTDPGRFCPTYTIFCESFIPHRCQPAQDQKFDRRDVYIITQNALADGTYLCYLRSQYNRSKQIDPPFFSELLKAWGWVFVSLAVALSVIWLAGEFIQGALHRKRNAMIIFSVWGVGLIIVFLQGSGISVEGLSSAAYKILDVPFTKWGAHVEARRRAEGVYPPKEIYIPSEDDSQKCFSEYTQDVARRSQLNQLRPGEDVHVENGRVQVSGQAAVMNINGLLCKVIFENCPSNEFYIEESFPLEWMYPYETPFGIIMKINHHPLTELSQDVFDLDHKFWSDFSTRLCGNWITYDTSIQQIADFVERTYVHNNYKGYTGDRAFVRDDDGQKAFSKLRSSQAGMYAWRLSPQCPPEFRQKSAASQEALVRETDFAFKQAFTFCPFSPEALYRYVNFLLQYGRFDDAIIIAKTCKKLDPYNESITGLIKQLESYKAQTADRTQAMNQITAMENTARTNPNNVANLLALGGTYLQMQQTNRAMEIFNLALASPAIKFQDAAIIAQQFAGMNNLARLETALQKLVNLAPDQPEARYDLAALQTINGRAAEALQNLKIALEISAKRHATDPAARDLAATVRTDPRFAGLRPLPDFQKLVTPQ